ncbi:MAG TPA: DHHW family protein [Bacteroidia bacterium]|nr:DHHW family protein [Bacteroidia bacterium]
MKRRISRKKFAYFNLILFTVVLVVMGNLYFILPGSKVSVVEKRKLAEMPPGSLFVNGKIDTAFAKIIFSGKYFKDIDDYFADHFPFRENFVATSFWLKEKRGFRSEKIGFYKTVAVDAQVPTDVDTTLGKSDSIPLDSADHGPAETTEGVVIYDGRAMEIFGGSSAMAKQYAAVINKYQDALQGKATIYVIGVPSSIAFFPPTEYRKMAASEQANINQIYSYLNPGIKTVNAYDEIAAHRSQYIYFATDHHWTGLGAYYAYVAYCKTAAITPIALDAMTHRVKKNYLGSLYYLTRDSRLKDNPDSVEYWMVPGNHKTLWYGKTLSKGMAGSLYAEHASGGNSYGVFLGGDNPLMRIDNSDIKNGRKCVIVKNSYGNPFSTYFTANYETVFVVDYRYYNGSLLDLIKDNNINDVIFINGVFSANTSWHIKMIGKIMNGSGSKNPPPPKTDSELKAADSVKKKVKDSLKNKKTKHSP